MNEFTPSEQRLSAKLRQLEADPAADPSEMRRLMLRAANMLDAQAMGLRRLLRELDETLLVAAQPEPIQPATCVGERCTICRLPAARKVAEEYDTFGRTLFEMRHPLTAYICEAHFVQLFGARGVALIDQYDASIGTRPATEGQSHD